MVYLAGIFVPLVWFEKISQPYVNMDDDDRLDMLIGDHEFVSAFNEAIESGNWENENPCTTSIFL